MTIQERYKKHKRTRSSSTAGLPPGTTVFVGERKQDVVSINILNYNRDQVEDVPSATLEDCARLKASPGTTWINVNGIHDVAVLKGLGELFGLHPLTTEDIANTTQRPKAEEFESYFFLALKMLTYDAAGNAIDKENVSLILGDGYVLSFQEREGDVLDPLRERIRANKGRLRAAAGDYLTYAIMDAVVDEYFVSLEKLGDHIEEIDDEILTAPNPDHMRELHRLKREIVYLRKAVWPLREEIAALEKSESPLIGASIRVFLRDLYDHTIQIIEMVESYRDIIGGMHDTFLSSISNRMNQVMKVLTIIGTIFIPLTFIAGLYGMNFRYMPELKWHYGYFILLGVMAAMALAMLVLFRVRKWL